MYHWLVQIVYLLNFFQIMDPKMDSGIACTYYSLDEAIENGVAPVPLSADKTTDVQCVIDIMDHLLACEVFIPCCLLPLLYMWLVVWWNRNFLL